MKHVKFLQLIVIASVFALGSCGKLTELNPCDCEVAQESYVNPLTIGKLSHGTLSIGQSFVLSKNKTIKKVSIPIVNFGNQTAPLKVTIYADNGIETAPDANTVIATSVNTLASNSSTQWVNFCISADCVTSSVSLSKDVRYWIVISRPTSIALSNTSYFNIGADLEGYADGRASVMNSNNVGAWTNSNLVISNIQAYDMAFRIGCESTDVACD